VPAPRMAAAPHVAARRSDATAGSMPAAAPTDYARRGKPPRTYARSRWGVFVPTTRGRRHTDSSPKICRPSRLSYQAS